MWVDSAHIKGRYMCIVIAEIKMVGWIFTSLKLRTMTGSKQNCDQIVTYPVCWCRKLLYILKFEWHFWSTANRRKGTPTDHSEKKIHWIAGFSIAHCVALCLLFSLLRNPDGILRHWEHVKAMTALSMPAGCKQHAELIARAFVLSNLICIERRAFVFPTLTFAVVQR